MNYIDLFSGIGGFALGAYWAGMKSVATNKGVDMTEAETQKMIFKWAKLWEGKVPELKLLHGNMEGVKLYSYQQGAKCKALGMRKEHPDIDLPVARHGYHALYIELKVGKNNPTESQIEYLRRLNDCGNLAVVCYGYENAVITIQEYLEIDVDY